MNDFNESHDETQPAAEARSPRQAKPRAKKTSAPIGRGFEDDHDDHDEHEAMPAEAPVQAQPEAPAAVTDVQPEAGQEAEAAPVAEAEAASVAETAGEAERESEPETAGEVPIARSFHDFGLREDLLKALDEVGYTSPTPIQARTIPLLINGFDVIGCAQTGTGKTAAFAVPVLEKLPGKSQHPMALIITPTRELAEQIFQNILDYSRYMPTRSVVIYGGVPSRGQEAQLKKGCDIVIATPGRLLDLLGQRSLRLYDVKFLILDEADRMLDMGFIPDIENIMTYVPRKRQTLLFSATMPPEIEKLARKITVPDAEMIVEGIRSAAADTVAQKIYKVEERDKFSLLLKLMAENDMTSTIIFSRTKVGTANLAKQLINQGIGAATIHSNLTQTQRQSSLDGFKRGDYNVLVATDIAARGLDISQVSHVINYDTPTHPEDYVHRIGRTGRAQSTGEAFTFCSPEEKKYLRAIERLIGRSLEVEEVGEVGKAGDRGRDRGRGRDRDERGRDREERGRGRDRDDRGRDERGRGRSRRDEAPAREERGRRGRHEEPAERSEPRRGRREEPARQVQAEPIAARHAEPADRQDRHERSRGERRHGKHENRMKEHHQERRPMPRRDAEPGQAALTELRRARGHEPAPAPRNQPAGRKPTEFIPRNSQQGVRLPQDRNLNRQPVQRPAQPRPEAEQQAPRQDAGRGSRGGSAPQHAAYHATRFMRDDDVDFIDDI